MTDETEKTQKDPQQQLKDYFFNLILYRYSKHIPAFLEEYPEAPHWTFKFGLTPLIEAVRQGHNEIVEMLLKAGVDVHARTDNGYTAMIYAGRDDNPGAFDLLLKAGANINDRTNNGDTALTQAIEGWHSYAALELIRRGADIELSGWNGETPLVDAAWRGDSAVCTELLRAGANLDATDRQGRNAFTCAQWGRDNNTDNQKWLDTLAVLEPVYAAKDKRALEGRLSEIEDNMHQGAGQPVAVGKALSLKARVRRMFSIH